MKRLAPYLTVLVIVLSGCEPDESNYPNWKVYDTSNSPLPTDAISHVVVDGNDRVWVLPSPNDGTLYLLENEEWSTVALPAQGTQSWIIDLQVDELNRLWVCYTSDSVLMYDGTQWQSYVYPQGNLDIRDMALEQNGFWLATHSGLIHYADNAWQTYSMDNSGLPSNELACVATDIDGTVWTGTFRDPMSTVGSDGLVHFDGTEWITYTTENSILLRDRISTLDISADGRKWIMSDGIVEIDGETWTLYDRSTIPAFSGVVVSRLHAEIDKLFVISSQQGLVRFSGNEWVRYNTGNSGLPDDRVNAVKVNSIDEIYVATVNGLAVFTE